MIWAVAFMGNVGIVPVSDTYKSVFVKDVDLSKAKSYTFKVKGIVCIGCVKRIERSLKKVEGVLGVQYYWDKGEMEVWFKGDLKPEDIIKAIRNAGYKAELVKGEKNENGS